MTAPLFQPVPLGAIDLAQGWRAPLYARQIAELTSQTAFIPRLRQGIHR